MNIIKELTLEETSLKEEMKNNCLTKGKYIDDKAKDKFKMLCHLEDFEVQYHTLNKGIDELIKKYEEEMNIYTNEINNWTNERKNSDDSNYKEYCMCIIERNKESKTMARDFIQDLKRLKGE